ncbi:hypothetical protein B0T11DRAFT_333908 [Plectosphaerella cucumerina]|uniref:Post-SET domain-containing protein n=1 Tax=Plectosphaerella cucumerina TaxID=40658 RepID=A0A8K0TAX8_9PEZI|nr:hypothetical protein B0T11DRAFT_333908 [Plectosphaerella cucumerina]
MAPLTPHWAQPSHPEIQKVIKASETEFLTKSVSTVALPPFALYAKMSFPPCTMATEPTYATVQCGRDSHLNLNSDLLYINHSCDPSLIFDTGNFEIIVGPKGIKPGDELTFFYPSTEWSMAQPFDCFCNAPTCRGTISGARDMPPAKLDGLWLNGHIRELKEEQQRLQQNGQNGHKNGIPSVSDPTAQSLRDALHHAQKVVDAARSALRSYEASAAANGHTNGHHANGEPAGFPSAAARRGPTSRELSGEMGGDTTIAV